METKRVRYLLGLSSPAEREHIELEYFKNEDAFKEMLRAEDDLIDSYARGELTAEERRGFEKNFASSLRGRDRVQFARAFTVAVSATRSGGTKLSGTLLDFQPFQPPSLLRTAGIVAVIVFMALLAWLVIDRRRMTNELRELRAESAELSKRTETLLRSSDAERTQTAEINTQLAELRVQTDKPQHVEGRTTATERGRHLRELKNDRQKFAMIKAKPDETIINIPSAAQKITLLPLESRSVSNLLTLQPAATRDGYVAGGRADQSNITLDGIDITEPLKTYIMPRNTSSSGGTTVRGTVKDPQGNVVSSATVTLADPARNFTRTQSTDKNGAYVFNAMPPGTYSIEVKAQNFKTASASRLAIPVDTPTVWDMQLELGPMSERIEVTIAADVLINRDDATLGNRFERKRISELPLNATNAANLTSLESGIRPAGFVNGGRADQSSIMLGSVDATIGIPSSLSWIRFRIALETVAIHEDYRVTIKTADGRPVTSVDWIEPLTPNQTILDTPIISTGDLPSGDYVLLLIGKESDGSLVKVAEYSFKAIKY